MNLYEMTEQTKALYDLLEQEEIDEETVKDTMESMGVEEKLVNYVYVIKELENDASKFKAEEERLAGRRKTIENSIGRMKQAVQDFMIAQGTDKTEAGTFKLRINKSDAIEITDEMAIPAEFKKPQPDKISKADIKKALKAGQEIAGATLIQNTSVVIK